VTEKIADSTQINEFFSRYLAGNYAVSERVLMMRYPNLCLGNSRSNHPGAQGNFKIDKPSQQGTDISVTAISAPAVASPTVLDHALPERACIDWVPARNVRAPGTDCLSRVVNQVHFIHESGRQSLHSGVSPEKQKEHSNGLLPARRPHGNVFMHGLCNTSALKMHERAQTNIFTRVNPRSVELASICV